MKRVFVFFILLVALVVSMYPNQNNMAQAADSKQAIVTATCQSDCHSCAEVCEKALAYCQKQSGKFTSGRHIYALKDCINTCKANADLMDKNQSTIESCRLCKEACLKCAAACEAFTTDPTMQNCVDQCRKCAESCENMGTG